MIAYDRTTQSMSQALDQHVTAIAENICEKKGELKESGLLSGKAGIAILFAYLSEIFPEKRYLQDTFDLLEDLEHSLSNDELTYNMSSGVAGIAFTFQHLR